MKCDYKALNDYVSALNRNFYSIVNSLNKIENSLKVITSNHTWDSNTSSYYANLCNSIYNSFDIINDKFGNINLYLNSVVSNYKTLDKM